MKIEKSVYYDDPVQFVDDVAMHVLVTLHREAHMSHLKGLQKYIQRINLVQPTGALSNNCLKRY